MKKKIHWYKTAQSPTPYQFDLRIDIPDSLYKIIKSLDEMGYTTLIVGGAVRDAIMQEENKDIDLEVYGIGYEKLGEILNQFDATGKAKFVGKSFGVITTSDLEGNDFDFALPRRERKIGDGHKGFEVEFDESITPKEAASRRDFTINSLAFNPITKELHDYFNGVEDINNKILRATGPAFAEDSLRALRGMQFASRFNMTVEPETAKMIKSLRGEPLTKERIAGEWMKLFTKGKFPSKGLQYLIDTGWSEVYPEIQSIIGVEQDPIWHPEGTLEKHISFAMDAAADIALREGIEGEDKAVLVAAALCHDLGKPETTFNEYGVIKSPGHDKISAEKTQTLLDSLGIKKDITDRVVPLVAQHMYHVDYEGTKKKNPIHLSDTLNPATIKELIHVIEMDHAARPPSSAEIPDKVKQLREESIEKGVYENIAPPLIQGRDIMQFFNEPGPFVGQVLKYIRGLQLIESISTREEAMIAAEKYIKKEMSIINGNDILNIIGGKGGPHIGEIIDTAWEAQKQRIFTNKEEAIEWLQQYLLGSEESDSGEEDMKFSDKNMNYTKIAQTMKKPKHKEGINELCRILTRALQDGSINWNRVKYLIDDDSHFDDLVKYWETDSEHCLKTYQEYKEELDEEEFQEDIEAFIQRMEKTASEETEYGEVPETVGGAGSPDISEIESEFGANAREALDLAIKYRPDLFNGIMYIGSTNDSSVAGVYEPALTQEIVGEEDFQEGVAFRVSPTKIRSEVERVTSSDVPVEDLQEIEKIIIAEIMVHEASHAQGAEDEGTPVSIERSFLQNVISDKNQEREGLGFPPLPVELK